MKTDSKSKFKITAPKIGDEIFIGPMHVQAWKETYVNSKSGITEKDVDQLVGRLAYETDYRKNTLVEALANPDKVFYRVVRNGDDNIVGFFHGSKREDCTELDGVYLLNEAKGAGVGGSLMEEFLTWADKNKPCHLEVFSFNDSAIGFYNKYGFAKVGGEEKLYKDRLPFIEMVKSINNENNP